jgi:hypothetical protein
MQNHNITITYGDPSTGVLTLSDRGQTNVDPSDTVTWLIGQNSGVYLISSITDDAGSTDVFFPDPAVVGGSTNWKGTINPNVAKGAMENYTICWQTAPGTTPLCFDPKIQINP